MPGYEALTRKSELSLEDRNSAICILKFKDVMIEAQEQIYRDRRAELGIKCCDIQYADFSTVFGPVSEEQMLEVLNDLRAKFGITINVIPSSGGVINEGEYHGVDGSSHFINITFDGLWQMTANPEWHQKVTETIQHWLDESSGFFSKNGSVTQLIMTVYDNSVFYGYASSDDTRSQVAATERAWSVFLQALMKWTENHQFGTDKEDVERLHSSINYWRRSITY
jgi:hypothetical protein